MILDHDKYMLSPAACKTGVPMQLSSIPVDQITNKKKCVSNNSPKQFCKCLWWSICFNIYCNIYTFYYIKIKIKHMH